MQKTTIYYCMLFNLCAYWNETRGTVSKKTTKTPIYYSMLFNKRGSFPKTHKLLLYAIQLVCVLKWNKRDSFQKNNKNTNLLQYAIQQEGQFSKNTQFITVCYSTCVHIWNETRGAVFKKIQLMKICYWTCVRNETGGQFAKNNNLLLYAIQLVCVLKWNKRDSFQQQKKYTNLLQYAIQLVCILKSNKMDRFQKNPIDDNMLLNSCAKWNKRGGFPKTHKLLLYAIQLVCVLKWNKRDSFQKNNKNTNLLQYAIQQEGQFSKNNNLLLYDIQLVCVLKWNKRDSFQKKKKKHQFITVCYSTRGTVFKKKPPIYYSVLFNLCAYLKWNKRTGFQKNPIDENMLLNLCAKWNKRGSLQKTTIYYCMLFNLCAYWNETRGTVSKKTTKTPIYYSMLFNKSGSFPKTHKLLLYAIQLVCVLKWNKRDSFQKNNKNTNLLQYAIQQEGQFSKNTQFITVCYSTCVHIWNETRGAVFKKIQLMKICYWTCVRNETRGAVFQKHTNYYCMLFNLCAYWNETRGTVFKKTTKHQFITVCYSTRGAVFKKQQFITVWYSTCVRIEMKQEGQFSKKQQNTNLLQYAIQQEGQFSKNNNLLLYDIQLVCIFEMKQEGRFSKKKFQLMKICYWTCVHIWNETRGAVCKKFNNLLLYAIQLVCVLKWNKRDSFQKNNKYTNLLQYAIQQEGQFSKNTQFITVCYSTCVRIEMKQEG